MAEKKSISIIGESQRDQWHCVVNLLRICGGDMTAKTRRDICDELDRYIDAMEDLNDKVREQGG